MIEQFGPAADAQVAYLREQARVSYHQQSAQQHARWGWLARRRHREHHDVTA